MLAKDSVQARLERGLSFTEFSYMLLQADDFAHLHRTMGVELQMGGADQWGNITAGLELIRRTDAARAERGSGAGPRPGLQAAALAVGDEVRQERDAASRSGSIPARTSPYAFYQYWLNTDDRDVGTYLRWFTEFPRGGIEALEARPRARPRAGRRSGRWPATSRRGRTAPRRRRGPSPIPRRCSRAIDR